MSDLFLIVIVMLIPIPIPISINQFLILDLVLCSQSYKNKTNQAKTRLYLVFENKDKIFKSNMLCNKYYILRDFAKSFLSLFVANERCIGLQTTSIS